MSVELIITKSVDHNFNPTGEKIALSDWLRYIKSDKHLRLRTAPITVRSPSGMELSVNPGKGQSEVTYRGEKLLFLRYSNGELWMNYVDGLDDPQNPIRRKIVKIAKHFSAIITHDAAEEVLDW